MGQFLWYLPGRQTVSEALLDKVGIGDLVGSYGIGRGKGPDGGTGAILAGAPTKVGYWPERQRWEPLTAPKPLPPDASKPLPPGPPPRDTERGEKSGIEVWMGVDLEDLPGPEDLRREKMLYGHPVEMEDGNEWVVPVARFFPVGSPLPARLVLGEGGEWVDKPLEKYAEFSRDAEKVMGAVYGDKYGGGTLTRAEVISVVVCALGFNYRINAAGVSLLGLLSLGRDHEGKANTGTLSQAIGAVVDLQAFEKLVEENEQKKKTPTPEPQA